MALSRCTPALALLLASILLLVLLIATDVAAVPLLFTSTAVSGGNGTFACTKLGEGAASCGASGSLDFGSGTVLSFSGTAAAAASFGSLGESASIHVSISNGSNVGVENANAFAAAFFDDTLTVHNGPAAGQVRFLVQTQGFGVLLVSGPNPFGTNQGTNLHFESGAGIQNLLVPNGVQIFDLRAPIDAGGNVGFRLEISSFVRCDVVFNGDVCDNTLDFSHTLDLTRIEVLDANGVVFPGATFTAESGHDYGLSATPEPATIFLLGSTLAGFGFTYWRHRKRTPS